MIISVSQSNMELAIHAIAELEKQLFTSGAWSEQLVRQELNASARTYLLDVDPQQQNVVRGYAGYWYDGQDAELMSIAVHPQYQNRGIAKSLLQELITQAKSQGAQRMLLEVRTDNEPALHVYENAGFSIMGKRKGYYQPENKDAYTMSLELEQRIIGFTSSAQKGTHHE